jgi:nucleoside-triphosphatase THEP1
MDQNFPLLAAIPFAQDQAVDQMLEYVARTLVSEGYRVAGFIQYSQEIAGRCCGAVDVEDIATGKRIQIMQPLGRQAKGCRLDPQAMAAVTARALAMLEEGPDILILNRFGKGESEGKGLRAAFEAASLAGVPVLTSVKETYLEPWRGFAGGMSSDLAPDPDAVLRWCREAIAAEAIKAV